MISGDRLLPLPALEDKVGFKQAKIYRLIRDGDLPPGKLIHSKRLWRESEIDAWIERIWSSANLDQDGNEQASTADADTKAEPLLDATVAVSPTPVSVYWSSSYLRERYGISRSTLYRWIKNNEFPTPVIQGGHGSQSRWHADDVLAWEMKIKNGKAFRVQQ